jgi:integrase/recombinase XerD
MSVSSELVLGLTGPLGPYVESFKSFLLEEEHYQRAPALKLVGLMTHLSGWMAANDVDVDALSAVRADEFVLARRAAGHTYLLSTRALMPVFGYLRRVGAMPEPVALVPDATGRLLARFADYLVEERGLTNGTVCRYVAAARLILDSGLTGERDLGLITAAVVTDFVRARCAGRSPAGAANLTCGLRSFLRFVHATGLSPVDLSAAVPSVASRADVFLPRGVDQATVAALLDSCDRNRLVGRRDYAVIMVLARLGLRSGEAARLGLDDVDWRAGLVVVHGKGRAVDTLPLPVDVGEAVASYLSWEGLQRKTRALFVRVRAPHGPLAPASVSMIVCRACRRAGVAEIGAHRLRHSLATEILRSGAPLSEVAQALRHRSIDTTARYARVDRVSLRRVAAVWPVLRDHRPRPPRVSTLGSVARRWPGSGS